MKIRSGFVSNSSSASFIINLDDITKIQLFQIVDYECQAPKMGFEYCEGWRFKQKNNKIFGDATIDNMDMDEYLCKIGIDKMDIQYFIDDAWNDELRDAFYGDNQYE